MEIWILARKILAPADNARELQPQAVTGLANIGCRRISETRIIARLIAPFNARFEASKRFSLSSPAGRTPLGRDLFLKKKLIHPISQAYDPNHSKGRRRLYGLQRRTIPDPDGRIEMDKGRRFARGRSRRKI